VPPPSRAALVEHAPAKINLTLRIFGRRADGYHTLESLVVFAGVRDRLTLVPGGPARLALRGRNASATGAIADNLVLRAAHGLAQHVGDIELGRFTLHKRLPVAAGVGGGSSDAAAALRLLARANRLKLNDSQLFKVARTVGADVPVCLDPRPRLMRGIGEVLSAPLAIPKLPAVLVNPGVAVATKDVFALLGLQRGQRRSRAGLTRKVPRGRKAFLRFVADGRNDLEPPAIKLTPVIGKVLAGLREAPGCDLARMSGSGATCFGLFSSARAAAAAARSLKLTHPRWWVRATILG
jgi:4-diphosphocytidyl-2-C-methyl-D-erythritol kinase